MNHRPTKIRIFEKGIDNWVAVCIIESLVNGGEIEEIEMAKLSKERMGEIAFALLIERVEKDGGLTIGSSLRRDLGNLSKKTNIPREELEEFVKVAITRMLGRAFGMQHVSLEMSDPVSK